MTNFYEKLYGEEETKEEASESINKEGRGIEEKPTIIKREVELSVNRLKNGKAASPNEI